MACDYTMTMHDHVHGSAKELWLWSLRCQNYSIDHTSTAFDSAVTCVAQHMCVSIGATAPAYWVCLLGSHLTDDFTLRMRPAGDVELLVQVRCIQATLGDLISSSSACGDGAREQAAPDDAVHQEVQVATVDSFQVSLQGSGGCTQQKCSPYVQLAACHCSLTRAWRTDWSQGSHASAMCCAGQGMEKAVIILSTAVTRTGAFASDARRLNVALSRAKQHLFIVGKQRHLECWCLLDARH